MEAKVIEMTPWKETVYRVSSETAHRLLLFSTAVRAGFPSPAADYSAEPLDLNTYLTQNPTSTFFVRIEGDSMIGAHIESGDLAVVDRSVRPESGKIVLAFVAGEFTIKRLMKKPDGAYLEPENPRYKSIKVNAPDMGEIWGVVVGVVKKL
mgnify:FL=1